MLAESDRSPTGSPIYRVLIPIDTNELSALSQARYASALPNASERVLVTLTHVLHGEEFDAPREIRSAQHAEAVLRAKEWLEAHDIEAEIRDVEHPTPTDGIVGLAENIDADAIVLSGRKRGAVESALFGSVVQSIVRHTTRPVVIVSPDDPEA